MARLEFARGMARLEFARGMALDACLLERCLQVCLMLVARRHVPHLTHVAFQSILPAGTTT